MLPAAQVSLLSNVSARRKSHGPSMRLRACIYVQKSDLVLSSVGRTCSGRRRSTTNCARDHILRDTVMLTVASHPLSRLDVQALH